MAPTQISLSEVLMRTDDWLKFGEAKNGVLLALNCGIAVGMLQALGAVQSPPKIMLYFAVHSLVLLFVAITLGAASFIPRLTSPWWTNFPARSSATNILYFGDICSHSAHSYLGEFYDAIGEQGDYSKLDKQYAEQIVVNSKIAHIKHTQFKMTAFFTLSAALTPIGAWIYFWARK